MRWCRSQSLCWQNEPQYRAALQPLHVSLAFRPQFQQHSLESSCSLMTRMASSWAFLFASARVFSIFARSAAIISKAFCSASATAFCTSSMAWRFTSFTASSAFLQISSVTYAEPCRGAKSRCESESVWGLCALENGAVPEPPFRGSSCSLDRLLQ